MNSGYHAFCYAVYLLGILLSMPFSGMWFENHEFDTINQLAGFSIVTLQGTGAGTWSLPSVGSDFFIHALPNVLSWSFPFLTSNTPGQIIQLALILVISSRIIIDLWVAFIYVLNGIVGTARQILGAIH